MEPTGPNRLSWYALQVRPRFEKVVARNLRGKGFEEFLPVLRRRRKWSDRVRVIEFPLFPGYVFSRFPIDDRLPVLLIPGVRSIVGAGRLASPVDEREIDDLRAVVASGLPYQPWPFVKEGEPVVVERGALEGLQGLVKKVKNEERLIVSVSLLRRSVAVEIDRDDVKALSRERTTAVGTAGSRGRQPVG